MTGTPLALANRAESAHPVDMGNLPAVVVVAVMFVGPVAGCSKSAHPPTPQPGTLHGLVRLSGGPITLSGSPQPHPGTGNVLIYNVPTYTGSPLETVKLDNAGSFTANVPPGTYYLATTAATFGDRPCTATEPIVVISGRTSQAGITCQIM
jgi:hypothetical protein